MSQQELFPMFELKKDINTPNAYYRAGEKKTKEEWEKLFPSAFDFHSNEWFIDLTKKPEPEFSQDLDWEIINHIFGGKGLNSISYRHAAKRCLEEYRLRINTNPGEHGFLYVGKSVST